VFEDAHHGRHEHEASGQQKGSKRLKSRQRNGAQVRSEGQQTGMNRAIARRSSPIVVSMEQACHAGGRGFESRRSRLSKCLQQAISVVCIGSMGSSPDSKRAAPPETVKWRPGARRPANQPVLLPNRRTGFSRRLAAPAQATNDLRPIVTRTRVAGSGETDFAYSPSRSGRAPISASRGTGGGSIGPRQERVARRLLPRPQLRGELLPHGLVVCAARDVVPRQQVRLEVIELLRRRRRGGCSPPRRDHARVFAHRRQREPRPRRSPSGRSGAPSRQ
jgi:hypothetical protein